MPVLDGAGWHHSTELHIPDNLTLLPYLPEFNPAERLWRKLRQRYLSNRISPNRQELDRAVAAAWLSPSDDTECIQHLTNFDWIRSAVAQTLDPPTY
ncbi:hypothetical protein [Caldimonas tepidiphila]|uniref:hypothetical protein n=1 Tax=Caldimonas tepidiphila TaxID=2315841 RepID=UPI000E5ACEAB|nr:hypothetical protein [Caldimonas tepidiphila]